jgi:hypothetical protein
LDFDQPVRAAVTFIMALTCVFALTVTMITA